MSDRKRWIAYTIVGGGRNAQKENYWKEVGVAFENRDESLNVLLFALPVNGKIQLRVPKPRQEAVDE